MSTQSLIQVKPRIHNGKTLRQMARDLDEAVQTKRKFSLKSDGSKVIDMKNKKTPLGEGKEDHTHEVVDQKTNQRVSTHASRRFATRKADKLDQEYGGYRYTVRPIKKVNEDVLSKTPLGESDLSELSTALLGRYAEKAVDSMGSGKYNKFGYNRKVGPNWTPEQSRKDKKRKKGLARAWDTREKRNWSEQVNITEKIHPAENWHKNDPDKLMRHVYWLRGKTPPTDTAIRHASYQSIVRQLHKKNPAPDKKALDAHMNHYLKMSEKEFVGEDTGLQELSRKTLGSYIKKASDEKSDADYHAGKITTTTRNDNQHYPYFGDTKKFRLGASINQAIRHSEKRGKGIKMAADKLSENIQAGAAVRRKANYTSLDKESRTSLAADIAASKARRQAKQETHLGALAKQFRADRDSKKSGDDEKKKARQLARSDMKTHKEDIDLQELSKKTLGSYIQKASHNRNRHSNVAQGDPLGSEGYEGRMWAKKRTVGITWAKNSLARKEYSSARKKAGLKEDIDLQELSAHTLHRYIHKASRDGVKKAFKSGTLSYRAGSNFGNIAQQRDKLNHKVSNRAKGIGAAAHKIIKTDSGIRRPTADNVHAHAKHAFDAAGEAGSWSRKNITGKTWKDKKGVRRNTEHHGQSSDENRFCAKDARKALKVVDRDRKVLGGRGPKRRPPMRGGGGGIVEEVNLLEKTSTLVKILKGSGRRVPARRPANLPMRATHAAERAHPSVVSEDVLSELSSKTLHDYSKKSHKQQNQSADILNGLSVVKKFTTRFGQDHEKEMDSHSKRYYKRFAGTERAGEILKKRRAAKKVQ